MSGLPDYYQYIVMSAVVLVLSILRERTRVEVVTPVDKSSRIKAIKSSIRNAERARVCLQYTHESRPVKNTRCNYCGTFGVNRCESCGALNREKA